MKPRVIRKSAGVALVTAIFLLVVLSGLAVAVVSLTTSQQSSATQDEQSARAYQAAKAGIEWALWISLRTGGLAANPVGCPRTAATAHSFTLTAPSLSSFTVSVTCSARAAGYGATPTDGPTANGITITSTACNQPGNNGCPNLITPGPDYVQRQIEAQL